MAQKIDDSKYLWQTETKDGHTRIGLNDLARGEIGEISFAAFPKDLSEVQDGDVILSFEVPKPSRKCIHQRLARLPKSTQPYWSTPNY